MMVYLYKGVELPGISAVWDKEAYMYALIARVDSGYLLMMGEAVFTVYSGGRNDPTQVDKLFSLNDGAWVESTGGKIGEVIWANHDVYYNKASGGTLYLAATCPINAETGEEYHGWCLHATEPTEPTEPPEPIDPQSYLMGFRVGQLLQGMR